MSKQDIIIRQNTYIPEDHCSASDESGLNWTLTPPTPLLESKGLASDVLNGIIIGISQNAKKDYLANYNPNSAWIVFLPCCGVIIGMIVCAIGHIIAGSVVFGISAVATVITSAIWNRKKTNALQFAMENVRQYVEITLNEQWQASNAIRWSIVPEQTIQTSGSGDSSRITTHTLYHIGVTSLQSVPSAMNGNQVVIVPAYTQPSTQQQQQQQPGLFDANAPPAYASEGQALMTKQAEGNQGMRYTSN
eukprot:1050450_1